MARVVTPSRMRLALADRIGSARQRSAVRRYAIAAFAAIAGTGVFSPFALLTMQLVAPILPGRWRRVARSTSSSFSSDLCSLLRLLVLLSRLHQLENSLGELADATAVLAAEGATRAERDVGVRR